MFKIPNPTPAQALLLHTLEGILGSALLAGFTAGGQEVWTGNIDLKTVITVGISAFFASFLKGYTTSVKPADQVQAVLDTVGEVRDMLTGLLQPITVVPTQPAPTRPEPQPIVLPAIAAQPNLNQPMQWGIQNVPAPTPVQPQPATALPAQQPALPNNIVQLPTRHFGDSAVIPAVQPPATGQGS